MLSWLSSNSVLPVVLGVGCDHAGSLLWGYQAGHVPWCGLRGWLQLRGRLGLCKRSVCGLLRLPFLHSLVKHPWLLLPRLWPTCCPHKVRQSALVQDQMWFRPARGCLTFQSCTSLEGLSHLNSCLLFNLIRLSCSVERWFSTTRSREGKRSGFLCVKSLPSLPRLLKLTK